jgi:BID domain of Bartonella effector protein (Bep)
VEAARHAGGADAYSAATRIILADKQASAELKVINEALAARFGAKAFTENANGRDRVAIVSLVAPDERSRLEDITPTFEAIRRFGREQVIAERRIEVKRMNDTGPLLPAIMTHSKSVVEVALETASAASAYRNEMNKVESLAPVIWRDPVAATKSLQSAMLKPEQRDRLADVIKTRPEQFGALRGSDRLLDRLTTAGTQRQAALAAAETASIRLRFAAPSLSHESDKAMANEEARRARMRVEVPGLSQSATAAVDVLAKINDVRAFDAAVKALPDATKAELRSFEVALSKRLGPNVSAGDPAALASVPVKHRKTFEDARESVKTVTRAIDTDRQQRIAQERLVQVQKKDKGITR